MRRLVVNADDFGFTHDVNAGIIEAHTHGILTATTLMANGSAFEDALRLARQTPSLEVGVHLVLVSGSSVLELGRPLPPTVSDMLRAIMGGRLNPMAELDAQIAKIVGAGIRPTHMDAHKHTHLFPPALKAVARLSRKYGIPWVRRPFDYPLNPQGVPLNKRIVSRGLGFLRRYFHRVLSAHGCRTTDHFAGFQITGRFGPADLARLIQQLPDGLTEFMCHPGFCGPELMAARTRLKESRKAELEALTSAEVRAALQDSGVQLVRYGDL